MLCRCRPAKRVQRLELLMSSHIFLCVLVCIASLYARPFICSEPRRLAVLPGANYVKRWAWSLWVSDQDANTVSNVQHHKQTYGLYSGSSSCVCSFLLAVQCGCCVYRNLNTAISNIQALINQLYTFIWRENGNCCNFCGCIWVSLIHAPGLSFMS